MKRPPLDRVVLEDESRCRSEYSAASKASSRGRRSAPAAGVIELESWLTLALPDAVAYASSLLNDRSQGEDVVQDRVCRLLGRAAHYDLPRDGRKLLFRSITNACINLQTHEPNNLSLEEQGRPPDGGAWEMEDATALSLGIPFIDSEKLSHDLDAFTPLTLAGQTFNTLLAADNFHPARVTQGLLANLVDMAFNLGYGQALPIFSDQQVVTLAGCTPNTSTTYIDLTPYIILPAAVPEASSLTLAALGLAIPIIAARRRKRTEVDGEFR